MVTPSHTNMKKHITAFTLSPLTLGGAALLLAACSSGSEPQGFRGEPGATPSAPLSPGLEPYGSDGSRVAGPGADDSALDDSALDDSAVDDSAVDDSAETASSADQPAEIRQQELTAPASLMQAIVTVGEVPPAIATLSLQDDSWRAWFQERMGSSVEVTGVRSLGATTDLQKVFKRPILLQFQRTDRENIHQAIEHARAEGVLRSVDFDFYRQAHDASDGEGFCLCELETSSPPVCTPEIVLPEECACDQDSSCSTDCGCDPECGTFFGVDPRRSEQWYLEALKVEEAWQVTKGSPDVVVAVIDSGVDVNHPDFRASDGRGSIFWTNPGEVPCDGQDNEGDGYPDNVSGWDFVTIDGADLHPAEDPGPPDNDVGDYIGHGTKMTGLIAAQHDNGVGIAGVAPGVTIMPLRVLAERRNDIGTEEIRQATDSAIAEAIFYATDRGADIITMSLGGGVPSEAVHDAVTYAWESGTLVVASAGNGGNYGVNYPGSYPTVVSVTGLNKALEHDEDTDFHESVNLAAPGTDGGMIAPLPGGSWGSTGATSAATALTAGVAALIKSAFPGLSVSELRTKLLNSVTPWEDAADPLARQWFGMGRLDASRAVRTDQRAQARIVYLHQTEYGDGDHHVEQGEGVFIDAAWHVSGLERDVTPRLIPANEHIVSVETDFVETDDMADPVLRVRFLVRFDHEIADEVAEMNVELADSRGAVSSTPVRVPVSMRMRSYGQLPASSRRHFVPIDQGKSLIVFDRHDAGQVRDEVFASVFEGSFGPKTQISQEGNGAFRPEVVLLPGGDVGVAYLYKLSNFRRWAYRRYDVAAGEWLPVETPFGANINAGDDEGRLGLGVDPQGREMVVWSSGGAIRSARRELGGGWSFQDLEGGADAVVQPEATILSSDGVPRLFIHSSLRGGTTYVAAYEGEEWGPLVAVDDLPEGGATVPYTWQNFTQRVMAVSPGAPLVEGRFVPSNSGGGSWITAGWLDVGGLILGSQIGMTTSADGRYGFYLQPAGSQAGELLELSGGSSKRHVLHATALYHFEGPSLQHQAALDLGRPRIVVDHNDNYHAFSRQQFTSDFQVDRYWSELDYSWAAQPSAPYVWFVDGDTLENPKSVRANWYAYDPAGVESYMVAVGTRPGGADLREWKETIYTSSTFNLKSMAVPLGRRVYVSVIPKTKGVLSAPMGVSYGAIWPGSRQE